MARDVTTKEYHSSTANSTTSGAARSGVAAIAGLAGGIATTVQAALSDIITQLAGKASTSQAVPTGGATGEVLKKNSATNYDAGWGSPSAVADASTTVKGVTKLSVAPATGTNPIAVGDNDTRNTNARTPTTHASSHAVGGSDAVARFGEMAFYFSGALTVKTGVGRYPVFVSGAIVGIRATINTAPTGASVIVDVNKNGTTMYTTQGNRPAVAAGGNAVNATLPDVTTFVAGDYITIDVDQIGSTVAGSDLVIVVRYSY